MKQIAAIRTHCWGEAEERLMTSLRQAFGFDVAVVYHNRAPKAGPKIDVVDINQAWLDAQGLGASSDWGWRCGDYFYYALRQAKPDYDFYWLLEPDVLFTGHARSFFASFNDDTSDLLGIRPQPFNAPHHPFLETLGHLDPYRAIFAMTRFSDRALDRLFELRLENSQIKTGWRGMANDELFTFSHVHADPDLTIGDLSELAPSWFERSYFKTDPDLLADVILDDPSLRNSVFHPVRDRAPYLKSVASRFSNKRGFLRSISTSLAHLTEDELETIADMGRDHILAALRTAKMRGLRHNRKAKRHAS